MKIKGIEHGSKSTVWIENKMSFEKYMSKFFNRRTVDIIMYSEIGEGEIDVYTLYCQNRKVASKVLNNLRNDLKGDFIGLNDNTYEKFLDRTWGCEVVITVCGGKGDYKNFKVWNGTKIPF